MVNTAIVVPCVVLASIAVCMFVFVWWWFPRTWAKGQSIDMKQYAENAQRRRDLEMVASETATGGHTGIPGTRAHEIPQGRSTYVPPAITPY
ncbi:hypothetical protein OIDMADRAFT_19356 [Oidiodendron maius Zn]|uniref:Uncharacterized protein n=1 Tax=Oidiodendron maius (strain Zn) TaxID=913774 RepID=A0A0C3CM69_OIDMZ|nr:hypothetical protein OIDMADRAFT_19356 [Oidiodendron maius Zn]